MGADYEKQLKPNGATNQFAYMNADGDLEASTSFSNITSNAPVTANGNVFMSLHNITPNANAVASDRYRYLNLGGLVNRSTSKALVDNNTVKYQAPVFDFDLMPDCFRA